MEAYTNYQYKPKFIPSENFFILKLPNINYYSKPEINPMTDPLNEIDLEILKIIQKEPGLNTPKILEELKSKFNDVTLDKIKNSLKRHLFRYCEFRGSRSKGGYFLKETL